MKPPGPPAKSPAGAVVEVRSGRGRLDGVADARGGEGLGDVRVEEHEASVPSPGSPPYAFRLG
jgi:hypothetical protein